MKNKEETYQLTFKGLLFLRECAGVDYQRVYDCIELYMRRNNFNAIVLEEKSGNFVFTEVELKNES